MGHKVHPKIFRMATIYKCDSKWFANGKKEYADFVRQDFLLNQFLKNKFKESGIDSVQIDRNTKEIVITLNVARPGLVIGRGGAGVEELRKGLLKKFFAKIKNINLKVNVQEVNRPNLSSNIVLQVMAADIEKRTPFRRVLKQAIERVKKAGALGVKVSVSGRLNGAEIARRETLVFGKLPLQNLRADIDYASGIAQTIYGVIGVKVWIFRGEIFSVAGEGASGEKFK